MQPTIVPGVAMWSVWQPDRDLYFNSWFVEGPDGNFVVDPLPADEALFERIRAKGLAAVVITNRDHERDAASFARTFNVPIIASMVDAREMSVEVARGVSDGDDVYGWRVVGFEGLKTAGEFALWHNSTRTAIVGDGLWGKPAGALTLMPDEKLADPNKAALSLRRLLARNPRHILTGDGAPIFETGYATLAVTLTARKGVFASRINLDELEIVAQTRPGRFSRSWAEIGFALGAQRLGYALVTIAPGQSSSTYHWHTAEEELFIVWEGTATARSESGSFPVRRGDFIAAPVGRSGAHRFDNDGTEPCTLIAISNIDAADAALYPDSAKLLLRGPQLMVRDHPKLDYFEGEK
jgi:uncharacterized cupin superfamily protein